MKKIILKTTIAFLLLFITGMGCRKEVDKYSDLVEGCIVGSFQCNDYEGRGFCIILENNTDSIFTFTLSENIFDFPPEIIKPGHDAFSGGPFFFPDSLRDEFKIRFKYRQPDNSEVIGCFIPYNTMGSPFSWENWNHVIVKDVCKLSD